MEYAHTCIYYYTYMNVNVNIVEMNILHTNITSSESLQILCHATLICHVCVLYFAFLNYVLIYITYYHTFRTFSYHLLLAAVLSAGPPPGILSDPPRPPACLLRIKRIPPLLGTSIEVSLSPALLSAY